MVGGEVWSQSREAHFYAEKLIRQDGHEQGVLRVHQAFSAMVVPFQGYPKDIALLTEGHLVPI